MAHTHRTHPADLSAHDPDRGSNLAAWVLFTLGALMLAVALIGPAPVPEDPAARSGPATIEDWRGNSARITPAE